MRFRARGVLSNSEVYLGEYYTIRDGQTSDPIPVTYTWNPAQYGRSQHKVERCWDSTRKGPPWKSGGPLNKWDYVDGGIGPLPGSTSFKYGVRQYVYNGGYSSSVMPDAVHASFHDVMSGEMMDKKSGEADLFDVSSYGATAWNRFKPGQPAASASVFLAECLDTTRMLKTTAGVFREVWKHLTSRSGRNLAKEAASQHLNTQFGWLPFVSDVKKFYHTHKTAQKQISQLVRDSGQWVHRKGVVQSSHDSDYVVKSSTDPMLIPSVYTKLCTTPFGRCVIVKRTTQTITFSGRFRYYVPKIEGENWYPNMYRKLMGLTLTPETLWELVPFSWLVDYYTNIGDVISNASDNGLVNNLVAKYAYLMGNTQVSAHVVSTLNYRNGTRYLDFPYIIGRKQRISANPFGFGLSASSLSGRQYGILTALGISRFA